MVCKGLAAAKKETPDPSPDVAKLISYFEAVEEFKHSTDGFATAMQLEKLELHKEHVPMPLLGSKEVRIEQWTVPHLLIMIIYNSTWSILIQWIRMHRSAKF